MHAHILLMDVELIEFWFSKNFGVLQVSLINSPRVYNSDSLKIFSCFLECLYRDVSKFLAWTVLAM